MKKEYVVEGYPLGAPAPLHIPGTGREVGAVAGRGVLISACIIRSTFLWDISAKRQKWRFVLLWPIVYPVISRHLRQVFPA